jgi:hypothetical protein
MAPMPELGISIARALNLYIWTDYISVLEKCAQAENLIFSFADYFHFVVLQQWFVLAAILQISQAGYRDQMQVCVTTRQELHLLLLSPDWQHITSFF